MAVGANRNEIMDRVNHIIFTYLAQRYYVMDVNKASPELSIALSKINFANTACRPMVADTLIPGFAVPLVPIHHDRCPMTFLILHPRDIFISKHRGRFELIGAECPVDSRGTFYVHVGERVTNTRKSKWRAIFASVENKYLAFPGHHVLYGTLPKVRLCLPVPNKPLSFPMIIIIMAGTPWNPDVAEDVVVTAVPMISV